MYLCGTSAFTEPCGWANALPGQASDVAGRLGGEVAAGEVAEHHAVRDGCAAAGVRPGVCAGRGVTGGVQPVDHGRAIAAHSAERVKARPAVRAERARPDRDGVVGTLVEWSHGARGPGP